MRAIHKTAAALAVSGALVLGGGVAAHAATNSSTTPDDEFIVSGTSGTRTFGRDRQHAGGRELGEVSEHVAAGHRDARSGFRRPPVGSRFRVT